MIIEFYSSIKRKEFIVNSDKKEKRNMRFITFKNNFCLFWKRITQSESSVLN
jgi:hypothetical protein